MQPSRPGIPLCCWDCWKPLRMRQPDCSCCPDRTCCPCSGCPSTIRCYSASRSGCSCRLGSRWCPCSGCPWTIHCYSASRPPNLCCRSECCRTGLLGQLCQPSRCSKSPAKCQSCSDQRPRLTNSSLKEKTPWCFGRWLTSKAKCWCSTETNPDWSWSSWFVWWSYSSENLALSGLCWMC